jgi:hypothetical protein
MELKPLDQEFVRVLYAPPRILTILIGKVLTMSSGSL